MGMPELIDKWRGYLGIDPQWSYAVLSPDNVFEDLERIFREKRNKKEPGWEKDEEAMYGNSTSHVQEIRRHYPNYIEQIFAGNPTNLRDIQDSFEDSGVQYTDERLEELTMALLETINGTPDEKLRVLRWE
jgi:hypothetical protein